MIWNPDFHWLDIVLMMLLLGGLASLFFLLPRVYWRSRSKTPEFLDLSKHLKRADLGKEEVDFLERIFAELNPAERRDAASSKRQFFRGLARRVNASGRSSPAFVARVFRKLFRPQRFPRKPADLKSGDIVSVAEKGGTRVGLVRRGKGRSLTIELPESTGARDAVRKDSSPAELYVASGEDGGFFLRGQSTRPREGRLVFALQGGDDANANGEAWPEQDTDYAERARKESLKRRDHSVTAGGRSPVEGRNPQGGLTDRAR